MCWSWIALSTLSLNEVLFPTTTTQHVTELARVLRPSCGRVVLLVQSHQHLAACLDSVYFSNITVMGVNIGGYICSVVTANRTSRVFVPTYTTPMEDKIEASTIGVKRPAVDTVPNV